MQMQRQRMDMERKNNKLRNDLVQFQLDEMQDRQQLQKDISEAKWLQYTMNDVRRRYDSGGTVGDDEIQSLRKRQINYFNRAGNTEIGRGKRSVI